MRDWRKSILVLAMTLALSAVVWAHDEDDYRGNQNVQQQAYQNGYREGLEHGRADRSRGIGYNLHSRAYDRADQGYNRNMGSPGYYQQAYRNGYEAGYQQGYNGGAYGRGQYPYRRGDGDADDQPGYRGPYGPYGNQPYGGPYNNGPYAGQYGNDDPAMANGYRDGFNLGADDVRRGAPFNPQGHGAYKKANGGYMNQYGNKEQYQQRYRQGYLQGYQAAYRRY